MSLIFVDVEAWGDCPALGQMTEFGAVEYKSQDEFHGVLVTSRPSKENPAVPSETPHLTVAEIKPVFIKFERWLLQFDAPWILVSDNPAFDWQWINDGFLRALGRNPFGHSARRIGDYYAGLVGDFLASSKWKKLRVTKHDHNPCHDALGNVEAFKRFERGERG